MWTNKKFKKLFKGTYMKTIIKTKGGPMGERVFQLVSQGGFKIVSYESWQAAKKDGWSKIK